MKKKKENKKKKEFIRHKLVLNITIDPDLHNLLLEKKEKEYLNISRFAEEAIREKLLGREGEKK